MSRLRPEHWTDYTCRLWHFMSGENWHPFTWAMISNLPPDPAWSYFKDPTTILITNPSAMLEALQEREDIDREVADELLLRWTLRCAGDWTESP